MKILPLAATLALPLAGCGGDDAADNNAAALERAAAQGTPDAAELLRNAAQGGDDAENAMQAAGDARPAAGRR